jgi:hypothetical protein
MAWLIVTAAGVWIVLSGFILLMVCMNSSRFTQTQGKMRRYPQKITVEKRIRVSGVEASQSPAVAE